MSFKVQILARYGKMKEADNESRILLESVFEDEGKAREVIKDFIGDNGNLLSICQKFRPDYLTVQLLQRGSLADGWELLYLESLPL